jgi:hypothetical protein
MINLSNIDKVYTKDPKKFEDAMPIDNISWSDFRKIVGDKWDPGMNAPFDPIAAQKAEELGIKVAILNGLQLRAITSSELDFGYYTFNSIENEGRFSNWREVTGTPKFVVVDMYSDKVRLVPTPISNATVNVEGFITPPDVFFDETPGSVVPAVNPQIPEIYHEVLMAGALSRLYTLFEVEILNPSKAQLYAAQWQQGLVEAQNILQTPLRRQIRLMELSRGFSYLNPMTEQKV